MKTLRAQRAKNQQMIAVRGVATLAAHYGKPVLAAHLKAFVIQMEAGTLTWTDDIDAILDEEEIDDDGR